MNFAFILSLRLQNFKIHYVSTWVNACVMETSWQQCEGKVTVALVVWSTS